MLVFKMALFPVCLSFGLTAVHLAAMRGMLTVLRQLEAHGGAIDVPDAKGRLPIDVAELNRQGAVANYLKSAMYIPQIRVGAEGGGVLGA